MKEPKKSIYDKFLSSKVFELIVFLGSWLVMLFVIAVVGWYTLVEFGVIDNPNKKAVGDCYSSDCSGFNEYPN